MIDKLHKIFGARNGQLWLSALVAVLLYAIFSLWYFSPQLEGKVLSQHDVVQYQASARDIVDARESGEADPQWTGSMFSGMPAYMINIAYPSRLIKHFTNSIEKMLGTPASYIFFAMVAMWLMLVMMGFNGWVAIVGGAAYGLSTYLLLIIGAGHISKVWAMAYAPLLFGGCYLTLRGNMWIGAALTSLFATMQIGANHPQITYYFALVMLAFWISELVAALRGAAIKDFARRTAVLALAGVIAVGANLSPLWYTFEHSGDTTRGGSELAKSVGSSSNEGLDLEYATAWSYGRMESLNMLIPNFMGGDSMNAFSPDGAVAESLRPYNMSSVATQLPAYWGDQPFTAGPTYIGAVVIFLALLGLLLVGGRQKWWIVAVSALMLLLSWGYNLMWFTELAFKILPGYDKFRAVSTTLVVLQWTLPLLATMALMQLWQSSQVDSPKLRKSIFWAGGITAGICLAVVVLPMIFGDYGYRAALQMLVDNGFPDNAAMGVAKAMVSERASIASADALRSALYIILAAVAILAMLKGYIKRGVMLAIVGVLAVVDIAAVDRRYLADDDFKSPVTQRVAPTEADKLILQDKDLGYRVMDLSHSTFNDATASLWHRSIGGYHGAKLSRYQDLIEVYLNKRDEGVLDMLNTRYMIVPTEEGAPQPYLRESANGAAWFVDTIVEASSASEEMAMLGEVDLKRIAVVSDDQSVDTEQFGDGKIELVEYSPAHLKYQYSLDKPGVAIFSEIFYDKGWSAYIDGAEASYFRADYLLRAMQLPEGEHVVEWRFRAPHWNLIEGITLLATLIIVISLLVIAIYEGRKAFKA